MIEKTMICVDEAINIILDHTSIIGTERVATQNALNRVLAEDVIASRHHPPWDNSAMDGYAVQWEDIKNATTDSPTALRIIGEVQAGGIFSSAVHQTEAVLIMTGAPIPKGADSVIRIEGHPGSSCGNHKTWHNRQYIGKQCVNVETPPGDNLFRFGIFQHYTIEVSGATTRQQQGGYCSNAGFVFAGLHPTGRYCQGIQSH